ncbi:MAG: hypothetical protein HY226_02365 [Candidatus Vogelbacteria bacterium]|nr:hypothetical protein [Candidatus Vogelbacteria bacterium]
MEESLKIAAENKLQIISIETDGPIEKLNDKAANFNKKINEEDFVWKTCLLE